jgi:hypothetical protein
MKRITRDRHLTSEEAEKDNAIRGEIEQEKQGNRERLRSRISTIASASESPLDARPRPASWEGRPSVTESVPPENALEHHRSSLRRRGRISQDYLLQLEADEREPTLAIAARLAQALGMSLDELASGAFGRRVNDCV